MRQRCPPGGDRILTSSRLRNDPRRFVLVILLHLAMVRRSGQWVLVAWTDHPRDGLRGSRVSWVNVVAVAKLLPESLQQIK
jgi:uncharacterized membrane protein YcjF (UPF0283 family)